MKKSLIALAAVAASGAAMAQSSVTLFGIVDTGVTYVNGATNWSGMTTSGNASSRIGFRGTEDLGGGLKANFWLEAGLAGDVGSGAGGKEPGNGDTSLQFKRRSTVGLEGGFGEIRLGRELTAAYNATSRYDVFGQVGTGSSKLWGNGNRGSVQYQGVTSILDAAPVRVSNAITYISPNFSGFKFGVNYGFGEVAGNNSANRYFGGGLTYDNGPLSLGLSAERQNTVPGVLLGAAARDVTAWAIGGSYNFGVVKLAGAYSDNKAKNVVTGNKDKSKGYYVGLSAPVGAAGEVKAAYNRYQVAMVGADKQKADQFSLGYVHSLSKRTAVYGTYAYIKNKNNGALGITLGNGTLKSNGSQHGLQVGVRHSF